MPQPEDASPPVSRWLWLDRWLEPPWRALLTWISLAAASGFVYDRWWAIWFDPAISWFQQVETRLAPSPVFNLPFWIPDTALLLLLEVWFEPLALRLNLLRGAAWIAVKLASDLLYVATHDSMVSLLTRVFGSFPDFWIGEVWLLFWTVVLIPVLWGWRNRPWMCLLAVSLQLIPGHLIHDSLFDSDIPGWIWLSRALSALPYAAVMLYGTRLLPRADHNPGTV